MKRRNPRWGCPRIAQQIALAFDVEIDKDVVRRILRVHYRPESNSGGPSWLTFLGQTKDSLWSCDLFRCESATLRTHWVLLVMDQFTRRIIGFGVHGGIVDGVALCRMFQRATRGHRLPKYLSSDHDPLYRFHQWQANLRVLESGGDQDCSLRAAVASVCRATDWHGSARIPRPHFILDHSRSGYEAIRFSTLL
jgi:putative transposase